MSTIRRITIHNPFDRSQRTVEDLELTDGLTPLASFVEEKDGQQVLTVLNGEVIPPGERGIRLIRPNDSLVVAPVLEGGGGGGKGILRDIAMIAVLAAAVVASVYLGPVVGTLAAAAIGAAISIGGSLLVNALIPQPKLKSQQDTAIYGWSGPQMTARQGLVINKGYGIFGEAGNVISSYVYTAQDKQWLNMLISYGWGPARSITQIKINDNPLENYKGVQVEKRLGFIEQTPVSFFRDVINEFAQSTKVRVDGGAVTFAGHGTNTEAIEVECNFPKGLWAGPNNDGSYDPWTVFYKVEYAVHLSGSWTTALAPRTTADAGGTPHWLAIAQDQFSGGPNNIVVVNTSNLDDRFEGEDASGDYSVIPYDQHGVAQPAETRHFHATWTRNPANDPGNNSSPQGGTPQTVQNWSQVTEAVTGRATTVIRHVTRINLPSAGQWDIRVTKLGSGQNTSTPSGADNDSPRRGEEMWVTSIREIAHDTLSYPGQVLLGIRALATDQLSGSGINVTAVLDHGDPESLGYKHVVANDRPQAYYRLNESSGTVCNDSSGRGNNATYSAAGVTLQQTGLIQASADLAAKFDGAGTTKITTPSFAVGTDYSVDMWINPSAYNPSTMLAVNAASGDGLHLTAAGNLSLQFSTAQHLSAAVIPLNQISHVALVVKAGLAQFVINGVLDANSYGSVPSLTIDTLVNTFFGVADEVCLCVPSPQLSRMRQRYLYGISNRNKMEDMTANQPAAVCFDMLTDPTYGGGVDPDQYVDIDAFVDWSNRCNELVDNGSGGTMFRHSFNGVFDTTGNLQDSLDKVAVVGRARVIQSGGRKYTAVQDKPGTAVQMFTMGSIVKGSFKETWLALADRANSIDIQYSNSANSYKRDVVTVQDYTQVTEAGQIQSSPTVDLFGAVTEAECWHHGNYRLASCKLLQRAIQFDADVEAIATQVGDLFYFSHDVPQWGISGRIDGSTDASHLTLDRAVTMAIGSSYQLLVQLPTLKRYTGNVTSISGLRVFISGWANTGRVMRLKQGTVDVHVTNSAAGYVDVESAAGLSAGVSADLWDVDVIETAPVVNPGDGLPHSSITTTAPFDAQPQQFDLYAFGLVNNNVKTFRCVKLARKSDQQFTIYGLEYNANIYTDGTPVLSSGSDAVQVIDASNVVSDETFDLVGERWVDFLRLGWRPGGLAVGADIYAGINGGVEKFIGSVRNASSFLMETVIGQTVLARVVGFDVNGVRANYLAAPTVTRTMTGVTSNMLINSTFQGSLWRWDVNWRTSDSVARSNDSEGAGYVQYNVAGSTLAAAQKILSQLSIPSSEWAVGDYVMLSGYFEGGGSATGNVAFEIVFNGAGTTVRAEYNLNTATPSGSPTRMNTPAATQVPVGTTSIDIVVRIRDGGSGVSVPVGTLLKFSHLLFEVVANNAVSTPSKWADLDNGTTAQNTLSSGDASALANAGSVAPVISGQFAVTVTDTQATVSWTGMKLQWGAGANGFITNIQDGSYVVSSLTASTQYTELPFYDIGGSGAIKFPEGFTNSHGSPAGAYSPSVSRDAAQAQVLKGRVQMGSIIFTMNTAGNTTGTNSTSGGSGGIVFGGRGFTQ